MYGYDTKNDCPSFLKKKEIFSETIGVIYDSMWKLREEIDYDDLTYHFKGKEYTWNKF